MPSLSLRQRIERRELRQTDLFRDVAVRVRIKETGELGPIYGGRWHTEQRRYLDPWEVAYHGLCAADTGDELAVQRAKLRVHTMDLSIKQAELAEDFATKLIMANGGRRGGKSRASAGKTVLHLVRYPRTSGELISPSFRKAKIMWRYVRQMLPSEWVDEARKPPNMWIRTMVGSEVAFLSAYDPDSLIGEGVGWIGFDEFQSITETAFGLAIPAVSDGGTGFQVWGCGTPRMGEYRTRYERFRTMQEQGMAKILRFTARDNPFIATGKGTIFDIAQGVLDERTRLQEMEALFVSEEGLVYFAFDRPRHVKSFDEAKESGEYVDITRNYLHDRLSKTRPYNWVIGVDYGLGRQFAIVYKIVSCPNGKAGLFAVDEVILERDASVKTLGLELLERGYWPAAVCDDASGPKSKKDEGAGITLDMLRVERGGKQHQPFDVYHYSSNKRVQTRVGTVNSLLEHGRYMVDPKCSRLCFSYENQELENGKPRRSKPGEVSLHDPADAAGYPAVYLLPASVQWSRHEQLLSEAA